MYYGADYYPEHWPETRWDDDARLMQAAGFNVVRMAEFAWTRMEPEEGAFNFAWLDRAIELLSHYGIDSVLGTPTAAPPAWIMTAHPEATLVNEARQPITYGSRRNYCPSNAIYRQHSARIVRAMAEHYAGNPHVIGWQIDNEFGGRCYCPACQAAFQGWLEKRYGTLDALNAAWGTEFWSHIYTAWEQIPLPWSTTGLHNPALALNYRRFMSDSYADYQKAQIDILREVCPGVPITHNLMGFGYPNLDYFDLTRDLDWVSWDNYPRFRGEPDAAGRALAHDTMRGLKDKPFWVMEEQGGPTGNAIVALSPRPGEIPYWSWQAVAHGADGIVYFRWRTARFGAEEYWHGILDHHGVPGRRYNEVSAMGEAVQRIGDRLKGSVVQCQAAMLLSYDSRFAFQNQPHNPHLDYPKVFASLYRALWKRNVGVQIVAPEADLSQYRLVVAPLLYILDDALAERLKQYVADGGTLILTCRTGVMDVDNMVVDARLPGLLRELCGVVVDEYDSLEDGRSVPLQGAGSLEGAGGNASAWADVLSLQDAEVLAHYAGEYYAGIPAVTVNGYGKGRAVYVGTLPDAPFADTLMEFLAEELGLSSPVKAEAGLEVVERVSGDRRYLFLLNGTAEDKTADVGAGGQELIADVPVSGTLTVPPLGVRVIERGGE
jgi:beta-galactosidase